MQAVSEYSHWESHLAGDAGGRFTPGSMLAGRYRLDEVIGRGGMATVWRGHDQRLGRDVAIKVCPPAAQCPATIREERFSSTLLHPNVVSIFDAGDISAAETGGSFIVMEFVDGTTAQQFAPVPWREAVRLVRQAAEGLAAAHERGIVHCDVKPGNLLIDRRGRVLVADFGIAMSAESETGEFVHGSPAYIAPERLSGERADPRVDVYGLGGVLSFLITGLRPSDDGVGYLSTCPQAIVDVISRARSRDPRERFADAREFGWALDAVTGNVVTKRREDTIQMTAPLPLLPPVDRNRPPVPRDGSRQVFSHPTRSRPEQSGQLAQETAAMSYASVRLARPAVPAQPRRHDHRPAPRHRFSTLVAAGLVGLLLVLAGSLILREIVRSDPGALAAPLAAATVEVRRNHPASIERASHTFDGQGQVFRVDVHVG